MNERREPTISSMGADSEPAQSRARGVQPNRPNGPPPVSSRPVIVRSPVAPFALIVALLALGLGGFIYWQFTLAQKELALANANIASADARIADLEKRLMLSDDESTQSITVVQAKVVENSAEIRKLWGVAYDTNRKAIAELNEQFQAMQKSLKTSEAANQKALKDIAGELQVLGDLTEAQQTVIARSDQWMNQQKQSLEAVVTKVNTLDTQLSKRLKDNEDAIKAIDAFRVQVNRELIKLKGG